MSTQNNVGCAFETYICPCLLCKGEKVELSQPISTSEARGAVEKWLLQVQDVMLMSVRDVIAKSRDVL